MPGRCNPEDAGLISLFVDLFRGLARQPDTAARRRAARCLYDVVELTLDRPADMKIGAVLETLGVFTQDDRQFTAWAKTWDATRSRAKADAAKAGLPKPGTPWVGWVGKLKCCDCGSSADPKTCAYLGTPAGDAPLCDGCADKRLYKVNGGDVKPRCADCDARVSIGKMIYDRDSWRFVCGNCTKRPVAEDVLADVQAQREEFKRRRRGVNGLDVLAVAGHGCSVKGCIDAACWRSAPDAEGYAKLYCDKHRDSAGTVFRYDPIGLSVPTVEAALAGIWKTSIPVVGEEVAEKIPDPPTGTVVDVSTGDPPCCGECGVSVTGPNPAYVLDNTRSDWSGVTYRYPVCAACVVKPRKSDGLTRPESSVESEILEALSEGSPDQERQLTSVGYNVPVCTYCGKAATSGPDGRGRNYCERHRPKGNDA